MKVKKKSETVSYGHTRPATNPSEKLDRPMITLMECKDIYITPFGELLKALYISKVRVGIDYKDGR